MTQVVAPVRFVPGAPGVRFTAAPAARVLSPVALDSAAFVGLAPRGPAWARVGEPGREPLDAVEWTAQPRERSVAVTVRGWDEYVRRFGGLEGPGRLAWAVASFFQQGGREAHIVRVVPYGLPPIGDPDVGVAQGEFDQDHLTAGAEVIRLRARDAGSWGNRLQVRLVSSWVPVELAGAPDGARLALRRRDALAVGTRVRARGAGGLVVEATVVDLGDGSSAVLDQPLPVDVAVDRRRVDLEVDDRAVDGVDRREVHPDIALDPRAPRHLAEVLALESRLVEPVGPWLTAVVELRVDTAETLAFAGGEDRWADTTEDDVLGHLAEAPGTGGVQAVLALPRVGTVVVPDLYDPAPEPPAWTPQAGGAAAFEECLVPEPPPLPAPIALPHLRLDPRHGPDLDLLVGRQQRLLDLADEARHFHVLLDVPHGLGAGAARRWRGRLASQWAAAYHPWLVVTDPRASQATVAVPPTGVAAGIIARTELARGVHVAPADEWALDVLGVSERVASAEHDELHPMGVNVFLQERDGVRLTGARTMSSDARVRQLNVRRLLTMIRLTLELELQWAVFEPAHELAGTIRHLVGVFLRRLWQAGALVGGTEHEAFYVRCDETTTTRADADAGRLITEVGVAPTEPMEYLIVSLDCRDTPVATEVGLA